MPDPRCLSVCLSVFGKNQQKTRENLTRGACVQDAVPRSGKFLFLYKRPGQRVLVSRTADMVVRPSPLELCMHNIPGGKPSQSGG
jgi:hypothetical protein